MSPARAIFAGLASLGLIAATPVTERDTRVRGCTQMIAICSEEGEAADLLCIASIRATLDAYVVTEWQSPSFCRPRRYDSGPLIEDVRREMRRTVNPDRTSAPECIRAAAAKLHPCEAPR